MLDDRTSQKFETVQKDRLVAFPEWRREKQGRWGIDQNNNRAYIEKDDYIDYDGRKIINPYDALKGRVPEYDSAKGRFKVDLRSFDYFRKEAEDYNKYLERRSGNHPDYYTKMYPEEAYVRATLDAQEGIARGWSLQFSARAQDLALPRDGLE